MLVLNYSTIARDWRIHLHNLASNRRGIIVAFLQRTGLANEYFSIHDKWVAKSL